LVDAKNGETVDMSDNPFALVPVGAEIIRPALADGPYLGGKGDFIKWVMDDATNVVFEFAENGETNWTKVTTTINSELEEISWNLPAVNSKKAKVRMIDTETSEILALSERFVVLAGSLDITSPAPNATVNAGDKSAVKWNFNNVQKFDIHFSANGGQTWEEIARDVNATKGTEEWTIPNVSTDNAILRAVYNNDPEMVYDQVTFAIGPVNVNDGNSGFVFDEPMPNPFYNETRMQFTLPYSQSVTIRVLDNVGQVVAIPVNNVDYSSGTHAVTFSDNNLAAGVYYFNISAGTFNMTTRVVKIK
jgi:hypothetical protein